MLLITNTEQRTHYLPAMQKNLVEVTNFPEFGTGNAIASFFSSESFSVSYSHLWISGLDELNSK